MSFKNLYQPGKNNTSTLSELSRFLIALSALNETYSNEPRSRLYGATAGFCERKNALNSVVAVPSEGTALSKFRTEFGHTAEAIWVNALAKDNKLFSSGLKLTDIKDHHGEEEYSLFFDLPTPMLFSAKLDFIFFWQNRLILADSKCSGKLPDKPTHAQSIQLQFYSAITGIDDSYLVYTTHQNGIFDSTAFEIATHRVDTSREKLFNVVKTAYFSRLCIDNKVLPTIPFSFHKTTTCKYCEFNDFCWQKEERVAYGLDEISIEQEFEFTELANNYANQFLSSRHQRLAQIKKFVEQNGNGYENSQSSNSSSG